MKIIVNGEEKELKENSTIQDLLDKLKINKDAIVVELNMDITLKDTYDKIKVQPNDKIELIQFLGGG